MTQTISIGNQVKPTIRPILTKTIVPANKVVSGNNVQPLIRTTNIQPKTVSQPFAIQTDQQPQTITIPSSMLFNRTGGTQVVITNGGRQYLMTTSSNGTGQRLVAIPSPSSGISTALTTGGGQVIKIMSLPSNVTGTANLTTNNNPNNNTIS